MPIIAVEQLIQLRLFYQIVDVLADVVESVDPGTGDMGSRDYDLFVLRHLGHFICPGYRINGLAENRIIICVYRLVPLYIDIQIEIIQNVSVLS